MIKEFESVLRLVKSGEKYLEAISGKDVGEAVAVIRDAWDRGLLDIDEERVFDLEGDVVEMNDAMFCVKESIDEAKKQFALAVRYHTEAHVAAELEYDDENKDAQSKSKEALDQARTRTEEAGRFIELYRTRMKRINLPTFDEK